VSRRPAPPSGWPPPASARLGDADVDLGPLAEEIARRYFERHPEDLERYGDVARDWELHDTRYLLSWAVGDVEGHVDLGKQVAWLAGVLEARRFPLDHLASNLDVAAAVVADRVPGGEPVAERLGSAAALVRERPTFLDQ
jgi:hypothetical protein